MKPNLSTCYTPRKSGRWIDLTQALHPKMTDWEGSDALVMDLILDYEQCHSAPPFRVQKFSMRAGGGTHVDAPAHCCPGGATIDRLTLPQLMGPAYVLNVSDRAHENYEISTGDIIDFEKRYGTLPEGALVVGYSGWSHRWQEAKSYRNEDATGVMHFPTFSEAAAHLLLERNVLGIAIDTLSPDSPTSGFPVHRLILGAGKIIVENLAHGELLPPVGATLFVFPLKIENATEAPARVVAWLEL